LRFGIRLPRSRRDSATRLGHGRQTRRRARDEIVRSAQAGLVSANPRCQRRCLALHAATASDGSLHDARALEIAPNLWRGRAGEGLAPAPHSWAAIPTSPTDRRRLGTSGIDEFIFSAIRTSRSFSVRRGRCADLARTRPFDGGRSTRRLVDSLHRRGAVTAPASDKITVSRAPGGPGRGGGGSRTISRAGRYHPDADRDLPPTTGPDAEELRSAGGCRYRRVGGIDAPAAVVAEVFAATLARRPSLAQIRPRTHVSEAVRLQGTAVRRRSLRPVPPGLFRQLPVRARATTDRRRHPHSHRVKLGLSRWLSGRNLFHGALFADWVICGSRRRTAPARARPHSTASLAFVPRTPRAPHHRDGTIGQRTTASCTVILADVRGRANHWSRFSPILLRTHGLRGACSVVSTPALRCPASPPARWPRVSANCKAPAHFEAGVPSAARGAHADPSRRDLNRHSARCTGAALRGRPARSTPRGPTSPTTLRSRFGGCGRSPRWPRPGIVGGLDDARRIRRHPTAPRPRTCPILARRPHPHFGPTPPLGFTTSAGRPVRQRGHRPRPALSNGGPRTERRV